METITPASIDGTPLSEHGKLLPLSLPMHTGHTVFDYSPMAVEHGPVNASNYIGHASATMPDETPSWGARLLHSLVGGKRKIGVPRSGKQIKERVDQSAASHGRRNGGGHIDKKNAA